MPVEVGKAHKTITLATRTAKPADAALPTATLRTGWRQRADGIVDVERMLTVVLGEPSPPAVSRPSVEEVLEAVETKHAQWAEAQLLEEIAAHVTGPDPATIAEVIEAVRAEAMGSVGVVDLTPPAEDGDRLRASDGRPVHVPPSAVRYTTRRHLEREVAIVEWATAPDNGQHRAVTVDEELLDGLDDGHVAAVLAMRTDPRAVITVVGPVDAGGVFAELVHDPDVTTVELGTLHRFEHGWEADASLLLRDGDHAAIDLYDSHGRIHGHLDHAAALEAVADAAYVGLVEGRDVLVMAPTNVVVDELNATLTERLLAVERLDAADEINIAGCVFYPGQPVVTRANNRTLRYGAGEWVRNGDRWTVNAGTSQRRHGADVELQQVRSGQVRWRTTEPGAG